MCTGEGNNIALYKHCVISGKFCCSVIQLCSTLCDPMDCSMPGFPDLHYLLEFAQTHVHWWCHPSISSSVARLSSCPQSFPASGSFPVSQLFTSGGQSTGASVSASVFLMSIQGWFPLGLTDLISLSKGLSKSYPAPQFESINSLMLSLLYGPTLTVIHDYWKNHNSDYTDFCQQINISAF